MLPTVAIIAPGNMGAAVGMRLVERGVRVVTSLKGRSRASSERAKTAGMTPAEDAEIAQADFVLSIVPPKEALPLAERLAPSLSAANKKPLYVDCNAVSPADGEADRSGDRRDRLPVRGRRHHRRAAARGL